MSEVPQWFQDDWDRQLRALGPVEVDWHFHPCPMCAAMYVLDADGRNRHMEWHWERANLLKSVMNR